MREFSHEIKIFLDNKEHFVTINTNEPDEIKNNLVSLIDEYYNRPRFFRRRNVLFKLNGNVEAFIPICKILFFQVKSLNE